MRAGVAAIVVFAGLLAGCGSDANEGNSAVELTKRLPADERFYAVADIAALKEDLDLPEDADPLTPDEGGLYMRSGGALSPLNYLTLDAPEVIEALDPGAITAAASGDGGVGVLATESDTEELSGALEELGFDEGGGILTAGEGPAFRLEDGLIFVAGEAAELEDLPDAEAEDVPLPLLEELDAPVITVGTGTQECTTAYGATSEADGSGELAIAVDGEPDLDRLEMRPSGDVELGEPEVDGSTILVPAESVDGHSGAIRALELFAVTYDCD